MKEKILFTWSGGKDSAHALHYILQDDKYEVVALLTTVTEGYDRISMHGVRNALLDKQAELLDIPLDKVVISQKSSNEEYEAKMEAVLKKYYDRGIRTVAFGDIFLEDLKKWREDNLAKVGMKAIFPIWKIDTTELARQFIESGFKTILACVDTQKLDASFAGREFDEALLSDLPDGIDPCGENGEFHSFTYAGPIFNEPISVTRGECVLRDERYQYCDLF